MNFLAHLLVGDTGDEMLAGSFAGDFCRGGLERHRVELRAGIRLHRMVDGFAEDHPSFSAVRALLRPSLGLYAPVGADMLIDHLVGREWSRWVAEESLSAFSGRVGRILLERSHWLPPDGEKVAKMMVAGGWLQSYARKDGIITALENMTMRTRGNVRLTEAMEVLARHDSEIPDLVRVFLSDLFSSDRMIEAGMRSDLARVRR